MEKTGIIGAGAWGTALGQCLAAAGHDVLLWAREPEAVAAINEKHENALFMPGVALDARLVATNALEDMKVCQTLFIVTPAQYVRGTLCALKDVLPGVEERPVVLCAKGIEIDTGLLMSQVVAEAAPGMPLAVMTGPTFAAEIVRGLPSAVTLAAENKDVAQRVAALLPSRILRSYITNDVIGSQVGGAVKNVIAIACGIVMGRGLGESARAALMTRGLAEMARLAAAMGGRRETLMGLSGMGDLVLTCTSMQSRNYSLGVLLGQGKTMEEIMGARSGKAVTEGVHTAGALKTMAKKHAVEMRIADAVHKCTGEGVSIDACIEELLERPPGQE